MESLAGSWRRAFELAWEALQAGSFPVGSLVVDGDREVVAEGRNRMFEKDAPPRQMADNAIAHAEMNVLSQLPVGDHDGWELFTTLEPCLLCTAALRLSRIPVVKYAAIDPLWHGISEIPELLDPRIAKDWSERRGPVGGAAGIWGMVLPAIWHLRAEPDNVMGVDRPLPKRIFDLARQCLELGILEGTHQQAIEAAFPLFLPYEKKHAIVALIRRGERYLFIERGPGTEYSGYWCPLSGRLEPGETQEEALVREIMEEVGLEATPMAKVWECPSSDQEYALHWWMADTEDGEVRMDPDEVGDVRWLTASEFVALRPTFAADREFFAKVLPTL